MKAIKPLVPIFALAAIPLSVRAADPSQACAQIQDNVQRLSCYDAAARTNAAKPAAEARPAAPVSVTVPVVAAPKVEAPVVQQAPPKSAPAAPTKVTLTVESVRNMLDGRYEVKLQNGEIWRQLEKDAQFEVRVGEAVTLRPASMGSFTLESKSGIRTRVKRQN
jgi:hypothetical protein